MTKYGFFHTSDLTYSLFIYSFQDSHSHLKASVGAVLKVLQVLEVNPKAHPQAREDSEVPLQAKEVKDLEVSLNNLYLQEHPAMETVQALVQAKDSEVNPNTLLLHRDLQLRGQDLQHRGQGLQPRDLHKSLQPLLPL